VIKTSRPVSTRWLLIEVKGGYKRSVADSARAATMDLLAYRRAFDEVLSQQQGCPYGVGYAWGERLRPEPEAEILLCTPDTLHHALKYAINRGSPRHN
jgi:hypothetical protein